MVVSMDLNGARGHGRIIIPIAQLRVFYSL